MISLPGISASISLGTKNSGEGRFSPWDQGSLEPKSFARMQDAIKSKVCMVKVEKCMMGQIGRPDPYAAVSFDMQNDLYTYVHECALRFFGGSNSLLIKRKGKVRSRMKLLKRWRNNNETLNRNVELVFSMP